MEKNIKVQEQEDHLKSLSDYISGLWKLGGLPLLLIGLAAANIMIPSLHESNTNRYLVTIILIASGLIAWFSTTYIAFIQWNSKEKKESDENKAIINAITEVVKNATPESAEIKVNSLVDSIERIRKIKLNPPKKDLEKDL
jgi:hypothetical protein